MAMLRFFARWVLLFRLNASLFLIVRTVALQWR